MKRLYLIVEGEVELGPGGDEEQNPETQVEEPVDDVVDVEMVHDKPEQQKLWKKAHPNRTMKTKIR